MKHLLITTIAAVLLVTTAFADPIHDAAFGGDVAGVQTELDKGADVNAKDGVGRTPLHGAANRGRKEIVELLIAAGADVNAKGDDGETPLDLAIQFKEAEIADLLRKHGGKSGAEDSINVAAEVGNIEAVKQYIAAGTDLNVKNERGLTPLDRAILYNINNQRHK